MCSPAGTTPGTPRATDYERFARLSPDNGATWGNDEVMSDTASPLPLQPDPNVQPCYTGDYDRSYSNDAAHYVSWVDGRVLINGASQQDVFFDKHTVGPPPPPSPNLVHDLTTLFGANGEQNIDPGESVGLDERIRNAGNAGATKISGVLSSTDAWDHDHAGQLGAIRTSLPEATGRTRPASRCNADRLVGLRRRRRSSSWR